MSTLRRVAGHVIGVLALAIVLLPTAVAAQPSVEQVQSLSVFTRVISSAAITLVAGGAYFVFAPASAEATLKRARDEPVDSFLWGLGIGIAVIVASVLLALTVIGLVVAIPLILVFAVVELAAQAVVFVLVFETLLDSKPPVGKSLVGAAVTAGVLSAIPLLGPLVSFVVGSVGVGALFLNSRA